MHRQYLVKSNKCSKQIFDSLVRENCFIYKDLYYNDFLFFPLFIQQVFIEVLLCTDTARHYKQNCEQNITSSLWNLEFMGEYKYQNHKNSK